MAISDDPYMSGLVDDAKAKIKTLSQKSAFIQKSIKDLDAECLKQASFYEDKIIKRLSELNRLPADYTREEYHLDVNFKEGFISIDSSKPRDVSAYTLRELLAFMEKMK